MLPTSAVLEGGSLTTGLPGKPLQYYFIIFFYFCEVGGGSDVPSDIPDFSNLSLLSLFFLLIFLPKGLSVLLIISKNQLLF